MIKNYKKIFTSFFIFSLIIGIVFTALFSGAYYYIAPTLPEAESIREERLETPLRIYSRDGEFIYEFGATRRIETNFEDIPEILINAFLAAEDDRFFDHPGFDYQGYLRAAFNFIATGGDLDQGGSTITNQVARTYALTRDKTFVRKFKELILSVRIEKEFNKQEILELYLNGTFFGQHSTGVSAAAQRYFNKDLVDLNISDVAILAGIPQGPSINNPYNSPQRSMLRRAYVLRRMRELDYISLSEYQEALETKIDSIRYDREIGVDARYLAEMVRLELLQKFGPTALSSGLKVTTTIDGRLQTKAITALKNALKEYDERHGYKGPISSLEPDSLVSLDPEKQNELWLDIVQSYSELNSEDFQVGLVIDINVEEESNIEKAKVFFAGHDIQIMDIESVAWARRYLSDDSVGPDPEVISDVLSIGDVAYFERSNFILAQKPEVQGAIVALDPQDGAIVSLVGGYDFNSSNYNRAIQSQRQPGSSFKPFVYSAALENGFTAATLINDAPIVEASEELEAIWRPENYDGRFNGPTRLREALVRSLNLVSVRVVQQMGISNTVNYLKKFGFDEVTLPENATLALGAGGISPLSLINGYASFANGGYKVENYFIQRIEDSDGNILFEASPKMSCILCNDESSDFLEEGKLIDHASMLYPKSSLAPRIISAENAYLISDMMNDVVRRGTGRRAYNVLQREDLSGKTGTSNDRRDAWFAGFNKNIVAVSWVGFDQERSLGRYEEGGRTALPMWIEFMQEALKGIDSNLIEQPLGIVNVRINPDSGLASSSIDQNTIFEKFRVGHIPQREVQGLSTVRPEVGINEQEDQDKVESIF